MMNRFGIIHSLDVLLLMQIRDGDDVPDGCLNKSVRLRQLVGT
jgi:hypothetical protein